MTVSSLLSKAGHVSKALRGQELSEAVTKSGFYQNLKGAVLTKELKLQVIG